jgi:hypothetical protein
VITIIFYLHVLFSLGSTFYANELVWAVYPPYTRKEHDALEVLDYELFFVDAPTARVPSRVPLKRADVSLLPDVHHFVWNDDFKYK